MMTPRRPRLVRFAHPECWSLCLRRSSPDFSVASGRRPIMAASPAPLSASLLAKLLRVSPQVAEAVERNGPVVALESTIYTHGALGQDLARQHEDLVRSRGGVPAIVAVVDGVPTVGVSPQTIARMVDHGGAMKVSRRDIAYLAGMALVGRKLNGGTTISATMLLASLAGIRVFGTGGLGGVHHEGQNSMDVSADLTELGRTRVAVVSSGCKGFLDIPRTLEFLETQGCLVATFADGRTGNVDFPAFWARESGTTSPSVVYTEKEAAAMILAQERLGIESGLLFANPIDEKFAIPREEMSAAIEQAVREALGQGFTGSSNTPFILQRLKQLTAGKTIAANKALVADNIRRATGIAVELSHLLSSSPSPLTRLVDVGHKTSKSNDSVPSKSAEECHVLVAGAVAVDLSCDYATASPDRTSPQPSISNPANISQSVGGVGHNIAKAAQLAGRNLRVMFCSLVADDLAGSTILSSLQNSGLDIKNVTKLRRLSDADAHTAHYVAVNDANGNLVTAMADMKIFSRHPFSESWKSLVAAASPKWVVVDANWSAKDLRSWIRAGKEHGAKVAFEPVSVAKSSSLFCPHQGLGKLGVSTRASLDLASPNAYELAAMHTTARENGYFDSPEWFAVIDSFGITGAREKFVHLTSAALTDAGVPQQAIQLLPYIPTILTKLGSEGVLLTMMLGPNDALLRDRDADPYILTRVTAPDSPLGGVYMRLYPSVEILKDVVSVNGAGDTLLGVLIAGLAQGGRIERLVDVAQRAAVLSLKHQSSVNPAVRELQEDVSKAAFEGQ